MAAAAEYLHRRPGLTVTDCDDLRVWSEPLDDLSAGTSVHGAGLVVASLPRLDIDSRDSHAISRALDGWRALLRPGGFLIVLLTAGPGTSVLGHRSTVIAAARTAGLLYHQHIPALLVPLPETEPRTEAAIAAHPPLSAGRHVRSHRDLLVFASMTPEAPMSEYRSLTATTPAALLAQGYPGSVWLTGQQPSRELRKGRYTPESITHPGKMLPTIARYAINTYTQPGDLVLDPMAGIGTTMVEAMHLGRDGVGIEYEDRWAALAAVNIALAAKNGATDTGQIYTGDSRHLPGLLPPQTRGRVALVVTSPPYGSSTHGHVRTPGPPPRQSPQAPPPLRRQQQSRLPRPRHPRRRIHRRPRRMPSHPAARRARRHHRPPLPTTRRTHRHSRHGRRRRTRRRTRTGRGMRRADGRRPRRRSRPRSVFLPAEARSRRHRRRRPAMDSPARGRDHPASPVRAPGGGQWPAPAGLTTTTRQNVHGRRGRRSARLTMTAVG